MRTAKLWKNALKFGNHPQDIRWSSVSLPSHNLNNC